MENSEEPYLIIYGSETGQSESIAQLLAERVLEHGLPTTKVICMDMIDKEFTLASLRRVVFICSSTGDGDPPENAAKFMRKLCRKTNPADMLQKLRFTLLGLGDTNYSTYGGNPNRLHGKLLALGATEFYRYVLCDDQVGIDLAAEPWMAGLYNALREELGLKQRHDAVIQKNANLGSKSVVEMVPPEVVCGEEKYTCTLESVVDVCTCSFPRSSLRTIQVPADDFNTPKALEAFLSIDYKNDELTELEGCGLLPPSELPLVDSDLFYGDVVTCMRLTSDDAEKQKYEVVISGFNDHDYYPGDAFYFVCSNTDAEVDWLLKRLHLANSSQKLVCVSLVSGCKPNRKVPSHLCDDNLTVRLILKHRIDFRRPISKTLLRHLADHTTDAVERRILLYLTSSSARETFLDVFYHAQLSLLDILHAFPSCLPPLERLLEHLPRQLPRPLSVASAKGDQGRCRFVFTRVDFPTERGRFYERKGILTGRLSACLPGDKLLLYKKKQSSFNLRCIGPDLPFVMVGPGAGVAPFLAYLDGLRHSSAYDCGERWLFFGCRDKDRDYIYQSFFAVLTNYREELQGCLDRGALAHLYVAFSQPTDGGKSCYVQDLLRQHSSVLIDLLSQRGAYIAVCGDAAGMAKGVYDALGEMLGVDVVKGLKEQGRYLEEVWT